MFQEKSRRSIAIIGAGPSGLTLARLLHVSQIPIDIHIYEIDASAISRPDQGGTLDLHDDTGLAAIRKAGLWDAFRKHARYDGQEIIMVDKNATVLVHKPGGEKGTAEDRPEIDRKLLKDILLESVPQKCIHWGYHLREVTQDGMLKFDDREKLEGPFDLIVGADGAWSKVRSRLHGVKPSYAGVSGYEIEISDPSKCPRIDQMTGRGMFVGASEYKLLNAQRMGNNSIKVRTWFICPEDEASGDLEKLGKRGVLEKAKEKYKGWAPELLEMLEYGNLDTLRDWTLYELPVGCKWNHVEGYTLIGDASSLSTPFSGQGVNKAMKDALELADNIEASFKSDENISLDQAIYRYEEVMFPRALTFQIKTMGNKEAMFSFGTPTTLITHMVRTIAGESSSNLVRLLATWPIISLIGCICWTRLQVGWVMRKCWRRN